MAQNHVGTDETSKIDLGIFDTYTIATP